jgi:large subunit ribosomal protein L25
VPAVPEWTLSARPRVPGHPGRQRRQGEVPAVLYGRGIGSRPLAVDRQALMGLLARGGSHHVIRLDIEGQSWPAIVKELQWHPADGSLLHVDFHAVALDEVVHADVPVRVVGEAEVRRRGGVIDQERHAVRVACLPSQLPEALTVDVSGLPVGATVTVGAIAYPEGVRPLDPPGELVLSVVAPRAAELPAAEAAAQPSEPEVVGRRARPEGERAG